MELLLPLNQDMEHSKIPLFNRGSLMGKFSIIRGLKVWVLRIFYIFSGYEEYSQKPQFVIPDPVNIHIARSAESMSFFFIKFLKEREKKHMLLKISL
jgi:hypothetical protein